MSNWQFALFLPTIEFAGMQRLFQNDIRIVDHV